MGDEDPLLTAGREHFTHRRVDEARTCFETLLAQQPSSVEAHFWLALLHDFSGDQGQAIEFYLKALALNPDDAAITYALGVSYAKLGDTEKSAHYYRRTLELDPQHGDARSHLDSVVSRPERRRKELTWLKLVSRN